MTKTTAIFKFLLFLCLPCEPGRARATKFTALVTSILVLVAPSCHPGPVTHHVTFYPCCWMKAFMNTKRISVRRWTFSFWIFNYQLSVLLRRTRISSLSGPWLSGFLFGVMVYFAQQLPGGSKAVNPALNTDCRSMVPGCENRNKKRIHMMSASLTPLAFTWGNFLLQLSETFQADGCCKRSCAFTDISSDPDTLCITGYCF